jgi:hypothetical protein
VSERQIHLYLYYIHAHTHTGNTIVQYVGCGAPENTGYHRYTFLVYKQNEAFDASKFNGGAVIINKGGEGADRPCFKTRDFVQLYESPPTLVAVNCFQAQYDESVPELYAWLGDKN